MPKAAENQSTPHVMACRDLDVNLLMYSTGILSRWKRYFCNLSGENGIPGDNTMEAVGHNLKPSDEVEVHFTLETTKTIIKLLDQMACLQSYASTDVKIK